MTRAKTPGRPGRRRALRGAGLTLLGILLLGGAGHALAWQWLTGAMTVAFSDWVAQQRANGWEVEHATPARDGWPFAARLTVPEIRIAGWSPALPQGFVWEARRLNLAIAPPRIDRLVITAEGEQRIRVGALTIPYAAALLRVAVPIDRGPPARMAELTLHGLRAETPAGPLTAARVEASAMPGMAEGEPGLALRVDARQVTLPPMPDLSAFGRDVERASLDAVLTGPPPPPLPMTPRERAEAWHAASATLDLREVALRWGPLAGALTMALRLDAALQPVGDGTLRLERPAEAVGSLAGAGMIGPRTAATAQAVLGMMTRVPEGGGAPRVEVPVGIDSGAITVARIPLLRLRPIVWPETVVNLR
ncbi:DUF2125 domain-containing protein [Roseomonas sp. CAU 1739]|uniref:DUF2125 domain-containing protein n=1 Tax=Roseomonas sp. CAU 1739 TaxID=3140364 RepID=UPI00325A49F5